jgi:uncharacterized protein (DUF4415 family)
LECSLQGAGAQFDDPLAGVGKLRVNIKLDAPIVEHFKALAGGRGYQTLINDSLRRLIEVGHLELDLRRVIREELSH